MNFSSVQAFSDLGLFTTPHGHFDKCKLAGAALITIETLWFLFLLTHDFGRDLRNIELKQPEIANNALLVEKKKFLATVTAQLCQQLKMSLPTMNTLAHETPNAGAYLTHGIITTTRLLELLTQDELTIVIAHELIHLHKKHMRKKLKRELTFCWFVFALNHIRHLLCENFLYPGNENYFDTNFEITMNYLLLGGAWYLYLPFALHHARQDELEADLLGAHLAGNPHALISALKKISPTPSFKNLWLLLDDHPSLSTRIKALEELEKLKGAHNHYEEIT